MSYGPCSPGTKRTGAGIPLQGGFAKAQLPTSPITLNTQGYWLGSRHCPSWPARDWEGHTSCTCTTVNDSAGTSSKEPEPNPLTSCIVGLMCVGSPGLFASSPFAAVRVHTLAAPAHCVWWGAV